MDLNVKQRLLLLLLPLLRWRVSPNNAASQLGFDVVGILWTVLSRGGIAETRILRGEIEKADRKAELHVVVGGGSVHREIGHAVVEGRSRRRVLVQDFIDGIYFFFIRGFSSESAFTVVQR